MVNPRAPRVFNLYDIIGVFLPGATLLFGILVLFPDPPVPSAIWEYLFYLIVAFSLGHIAQAYSCLVLPPSDGSLRRCHGVLPSD